ncbi:MAG: stage III sporulation protein AD [Clostridia bacterium]|nr:stage III sporulation protein AD [Clostridia bacterium]MBR1677601.1 stage III sporulation protein AD [Clostridia bacterium]
MEIFKIVAVGVVSAILIVYLRSINSEMTMLASVCAGILLLTMTVDYVVEFVSFFRELFEKSSIDKSVFKIVIKIIAIAYLIEFTVSLTDDFGVKNISDKITFAGKILILLMSAPIIKQLIETVVNMV